MRYIKQEGPECFLAAICQVVPSMDIEVERPLYHTKGGYVTKDSGLNWVKTRIPEIFKVVDDIFYYGRGREVKELDLSGKGILLLYACNWGSRHAVSYEHWQILDSDYTGESESLETFKDRYYDYFIEGIVVINRQ